MAGEVLAHRLIGRFPLLDVDAAGEGVTVEVTAAVEALTRPGAPTPEALASVGRDLLGGSEGDRSALVAEWSSDEGAVGPRLGFWLRVAAAPIIELASATIEPVARERWSKPVCPACGGSPQVSAIAEESGEFLAGSPRSLICSRCASWWAFPRAVCPACGEEDSRRISAYHAEGEPGTRIDVCETCRGYLKTFDLRQSGARDVIPLVDDVATLTLDVWAQDQGLHHPALSLAGV